MKIKMSILCLLVMFYSCTENKTTQVAENTFVYDNKIYKIVDNELTELANLKSNKIRKLEVSKAKQKSLGTASLSYLKPNASAKLKTLYRGNILYFTMTLNGINDLKENYNSGSFTINMLDDYNFIMKSIEVPTSDLVEIVDENDTAVEFRYNGKIEMSTDINLAIESFTLSSTVKHK